MPAVRVLLLQSRRSCPLGGHKPWRRPPRPRPFDRGPRRGCFDGAPLADGPGRWRLRSVVMAVVIALDAGTTGVRSMAVVEDGIPIRASYREFPQYFPRPGWVE